MSEQIRLEARGPLTFSEEEMCSERSARLLEAGEYPDKGLTLTEEDLDGLAARFSAGLPVKVEHTDSPLDPLGCVRRVWREGNALLGTLAFPDDLAGFLRRRGAAKLSVGLRRDPLRLVEVSLVLKPRVAAATLMREEAPTLGFAYPSPGTGEGPETKGLQAEIVRLRAVLAAQEVDAQVAAFKAQGRIVPATEALARALLSVPEESMVTLSEGMEAAASVFRRFLRALPPQVVFGETAPAGTGADEHGFTQYEQMFLSERLGVDPAKVAALLREDAEKQGAETRGANQKGNENAR